MSDAGLLVVRTIVGFFMASHGLPKMPDDDHEYAKSFEGLGFHPGALFVAQAAVRASRPDVVVFRHGRCNVGSHVSGQDL
jgi:uncharacterized membrane protein YphA (DoxX/SURF4 family)